MAKKTIDNSLPGPHIVPGLVEAYGTMMLVDHDGRHKSFLFTGEFRLAKPGEYILNAAELRPTRLRDKTPATPRLIMREATE